LFRFCIWPYTAVGMESGTGAAAFELMSLRPPKFPRGSIGPRQELNLVSVQK
jgi:hypothetical protein